MCDTRRVESTTLLSWRRVSWRGFLWRGVSWRHVSWRRVSWCHVSRRRVLWHRMSWRHVSWGCVSWRRVPCIVTSCVVTSCVVTSWSWRRVSWSHESWNRHWFCFLSAEPLFLVNYQHLLPLYVLYYFIYLTHSGLMCVCVCVMQNVQFFKYSLFEKKLDIVQHSSISLLICLFI